MNSFESTQWALFIVLSLTNNRHEYYTEEKFV